MSTRVKIAIAAAIVVALVGLIILDQRSGSSPKSDVVTQNTEPTGSAGVTVESERSIASQVQEAFRQIDARTSELLNGSGPGQPEGRTSAEAAPVEAVPAADTYEVQPGDSLYTIAERKYGDATLWKLIADANPTVKPHALRVGSKLTIPARAVSAPEPAGPQPQLVSDGGPKTYVIQPGDSLGKISTRFYRTSRMTQKIFEANQDVIASPDALVVGTKIVLPDLPAPQPQTPEVTSSDPTAPAPADAGRTTYRVKMGDSLWKIAKAFANGRDITEVMERIREANSDKLTSTGTPLRVDWVIVIPE